MLDDAFRLPGRLPTSCMDIAEGSPLETFQKLHSMNPCIDQYCLLIQIAADGAQHYADPSQFLTECMYGC